MIKSILVPTDFSDCADNALRYAVGMAKKLKARIVLLHSFEMPHMPSGSFTATDKIRTIENERRSKMLQEAIEAYASLEYDDGTPVLFKSIVTFNDVERDVKNISEDENIDLIVMGTKGASGIEKVFLGSVTVDAAEAVDVPLLAVPFDADFNGIENIVYATDFDQNDDKVVRYLLDFAEVFEAKVESLHIEKNHNSDIDADSEFKIAPFDKVQLRTVWDSSRVHGLDHYLDKYPVDILVMLTHERSFFEKLYKRSLTNQMAFHSSKPLLILKEKELI